MKKLGRKSSLEDCFCEI
jgi:hypothetical protein